MAVASPVRRRKIFPNDAFTWLSITATGFLAVGLLAVGAVLESRYKFFSELFG